MDNVNYFGNDSLDQFHAVNRMLQSRQREHNVEILCSPLSSEFSRRCVLSGGTQRRVFIMVPERVLKILMNNNS